MALWSFSAALCRGLIEEAAASRTPHTPGRRFPRLYAAASLKNLLDAVPLPGRAGVFRGFMPRPH